jgi:HEAT repeat protein
MADSRARSATYFLARGLLDPDQELASICREGLVAIGGKFTGDNLVTLYRDAPKEKQAKALGVLSDVTKKGPVDAAAVSPAIGKFALSNDPDVAGSAISLLTALGKPGGPGLLVALDSKLPDKKVAVMDALAAIKYYRASARMAEYLVTGDGVVLEQLRAAAIRNLKSMGVYVVPYLIPMLSSPSKQYVALTLREITGAMIGMGNPKEWRKWWNENKPKDAEEP